MGFVQQEEDECAGLLRVLQKDAELGVDREVRGHEPTVSVRADDGADIPLIRLQLTVAAMGAELT